MRKSDHLKDSGLDKTKAIGIFTKPERYRDDVIDK